MKTDTWRKKYPDKKCKRCGVAFTRKYMQPSSNWKVTFYCSKECRFPSLMEKLNTGLLKKMGIRKCLMCGKDFQAHNQVHSFCGSKSKKEGCSYIHYVEDRKKKCAQYRLRKANKFWTGHTPIIR